MEKAKLFLKKINAGLVESVKKICNAHVLSRIVLGVAVLMILVAVGVLVFYKPARVAVFSSEVHTVVEVKSWGYFVKNII